MLLAGLAAIQANQGQAGSLGKPPVLPPAPLVALGRIKPDASIPVPSGASITVAPDGVWLSDPAKRTVARIDPKTNALGAPNAVDGTPCGAPLMAFKTLWVTLCDRQSIVRILPPNAPAPPPAPSPTATPPASTAKDAAVPAKPAIVKTPGGGIGVLATGAGSVWTILSTSGALARIDPDTNAVVAEVSVLNGANALAFANDALWVVSTSKAVVTRINGYSNVAMKVIPVGKSPVAVTSGAGSLWVLNAGDGTVSRIDPATDKVTETIKLGLTAISPQCGSILFSDGSIWLSVPGTPLARIDPASNRVVQRFSGKSGGTLAAGLGSLWLTVSPAEVWRIDPKRGEATR